MRSHHHAIARSMLAVMLFVVLAKLIAMLKEVAVAWRYGVGEVVDGYLFVINLVIWPVSIWLGGLTVVLVPLAARLRREDPGNLRVFRPELLGFTLWIGVVLSGMAWLGLPALLRWGGLGLTPDARAVALEAAPALALVPVLGVLISLFSVWMLSREQHTSTLYEGFPALGILLAVVLFPGEGVAPLLWGTVAGMVFHLAAVVLHGRRDGQTEVPRFCWTSRHWAAFWQGFGIMVLGQAIMSLTSLVDQFFVASLGGGAISTLGYANKVIALILGLGATVMSRATLPVFARMHVSTVSPGTRWLALRWSGGIALLGGLALALGWVLAPWGLSLLYERGAFTPNDTVEVVSVFRHGLWQLPAYFSGVVLVSLLSSSGRYSTLAWVAVFSLALKLAGNSLLIPTHGLLGVQWATALMYVASTVALLVMALRMPKPATQGIGDA